MSGLFRAARLRHFCWLILATCVVLAGCASPVGKLTHAQELQKQRKYAAAISKYAEVLARMPEGQRQVISLVNMRIAECQWAMGEPQAALLSLQNALSDDPENSGAHLRLSELMLTGGAPQAAIEHANWVLVHDPGNLDAFSVLGSSFAALGDLKQARAVLERGLSLDRARTPLALRLAQVYVAQGEATQARALLKRTADAVPRDPAPALALARLEEEAGNIVDAEESYRRAVAAQDSLETKLRLAQFLARASRIAEAEQILAQADQRIAPASFRADFELLLGRAVDAVRRYTTTLQNSSQKEPASGLAKAGINRGAVVARLVEAELALAHQGGAADDVERRIAHARGLIEQHKLELDGATAESLRAETALAAADVAQAEFHAQRALELAPDSAAAHFVAGLAKRAANDLAAASREWDAALEKDPGFLPAMQALAEVSLLSGHAAAAEQYIVPVIREEPANFKALCVYALALTAEARYPAAAALARRAIAADPLAAEPHVILGDLHMRQKQIASAFVEYEQAIVLEPASAEAMEGLAGVYRHGRITPPMLARMERVAASPPASATLMEVVGRLYADHGWYQDAERTLKWAANLDPRRATASASLANLYARRGRPRAAVNSLSRTSGGAANLAAGLRASDEKDFGAAQRNYDSAVRMGDRSGAAANNLAWIYAQQGIELDRALELARLARELAPRDPAVLDTLGFVQLRRREYSQAIETLKRAIELALSPANPGSAPPVREIKLHLAQAYVLSGQPEAAAALEKPSR